MNEYFTKLFPSLVTSTIWREPDHVRLVWITMLALRNQWNEVEASVPGLADAARVTLEKCIEALAVLSAPDEWSRTQEHEGRRIRKVDGGWLILNGSKYRELVSLEVRKEKNRRYQATYREKRKAGAVPPQGKPLDGEVAYVKALERGDGSEVKVLDAFEQKDQERAEAGGLI